jgi:Tol biopolymer transport system component/predicted Ser/Thr protein kinase
MSDDRWERVKSIADRALDVEPAQRARLLDEACGAEPSLRQEVESLLACEDDSFLERTAGMAPAGGLPTHGMSGRRLSRYEVTDEIGRGGMGVVYRARDTTLERGVALKVLHPGLVADADRKRRFVKEARAAATLNHPNIAVTYEIDAFEGVDFIAMELVEGERLADLLGRGRLPRGRLADIATEVADGLAAAHERGVTHRDLKPANILVSHEGRAKIIDFGLAKLRQPTRTTGEEPTAGVPGPDASSEGSLEPATDTTREGSILGTVPYMSPEQAAGRPVDHRSDQFSFGAILYEMATGRPAFEHASRAATLEAIQQGRPVPMRELDPTIPAELARIVERCLSRDPGDRFASTRDLASELSRWARESSTRRSRPPSRGTARIGIGALALAGILALYWRPAPPDAPGSPLKIVPLTSYPGRESEPTFSPDGSQVAFSWDGGGRDSRNIYVKAVGSEQPIRLTTDPSFDGSPEWSPDGRQIAFLRARPGGGSELRLVPPGGGSERLVASLEVGVGSGLSWSPDGRHLVVSDRPSPRDLPALYLLDTEDGSRERLTTPATSPGALIGGDLLPTFSPDGTFIAYKCAGLQTVCLVAATGGLSRKLAPAHWTGQVAWTRDGEEILFGADPARDGDPTGPSAENLNLDTFLWRVPVDGGPAVQLAGPVAARGVAASRDGSRLAYERKGWDYDVWLIELGPSGPRQTPVVVSTRYEGNPQLSPDGQRIAFVSNRTGRFELWVADGDGRNLLQLTSLATEGEVGSPRWSPDGMHLAFDFGRSGTNDWDVYVIDARGGAPRRATTAPSNDVKPSWSRDGCWIYFGSDRSGEWQVWRVPFEGEAKGNARQVTRGGGFTPIESPDGRFLYFNPKRSGRLDLENSIWRAPVDGGVEEHVVGPFRSGDSNWDVSAEGVYFVDRDASASDAGWVVRSQRFDGGPVREVARLTYSPMLAGPAFSVSSDGRRIVSAQRQDGGDLMLVEGFR